MRRFKENYVGQDITFKMNENEYDVYVTLDNDTLWFAPNEDYEHDVMFTAAVFLSSEDLQGNVRIESVQRTD